MILSADESAELLRLVEAKQGETCTLDPAHALVLYALKLVAPIGGNRDNGYMPTKAGLKLAKTLEASQEQRFTRILPSWYIHMRNARGLAVTT